MEVSQRVEGLLPMLWKLWTTRPTEEQSNFATEKLPKITLKSAIYTFPAETVFCEFATKVTNSNKALILIHIFSRYPKASGNQLKKQNLVPKLQQILSSTTRIN
jgi:hypothetical protein